MGITRINLSETNHYGDGWDAIFRGSTSNSSSKKHASKPKAKRPAAAKNKTDKPKKKK